MMVIDDITVLQHSGARLVLRQAQDEAQNRYHREPTADFLVRLSHREGVARKEIP